MHSYSQAPDYQRSNPYIHTGYRAPQVSGWDIAIESDTGQQFLQYSLN